MRRHLTGIATIGAALAMLVLFVGLVMPGRWEVERRVLVDAPPEQVWSQVADLRTWPEWTAWSRERDPAATWTWSGPEAQAGMTMRWEGPKLGNGEIAVRDAEAPMRVVYAIAGDGGSGRGLLTVATRDGMTEVAWRAVGHVGWNPLARLLVPMVERYAAEDLEHGLENLRAVAENQARRIPYHRKARPGV